MLKVASDGMFRLNLCVGIDFPYEKMFSNTYWARRLAFSTHMLLQCSGAKWRLVIQTSHCRQKVKFFVNIGVMTAYYV